MNMDTSWPPNWPMQAGELHIFDPQGDVLLILGRQPEENITDSEDREDDGEPSPSDLWIFEGKEPEAVPPQAKLDGSATSISDTRETESKTQQVQMRVSSKHLVLASRTFRTCLGSFSEGRMLQTEGNVTLPLPEEDPDAMIVLLHIIHGQTRKVPRQVSLDMLKRLAAVVNYYQIQEVVENFSDIWLEYLGHKSLPADYTREALAWLFIFWVFRKKDGFRGDSNITTRM